MKDKILDKLVFGTWLFDSYQNKEHKDIVKLFSLAFDKGIRKFDTAESYGDGFSEMLLGRALKKNRDDIEIYSKFNFHLTKKQEIENALQKTLKRLNTDYLDIYFQHWPSVKVNNSSVIEIMLELKEKQYFKKLGVSNWDIDDFEKCEYSNLIEVNQICYNPLWRKAEENLLPFLNEKNIKTLSYSPYCQGLLVKENFKPTDYARKKLIFCNDKIEPIINDFKKELTNLSNKHSIKIQLLLILWNLKNIDFTIFSGTKLEQLSSLDLSLNKLTISEENLNSIFNKIDNLSEDFIQYVENYSNPWNWQR